MIIKEQNMIKVDINVRNNKRIEFRKIFDQHLHGFWCADCFCSISCLFALKCSIISKCIPIKT